MARNSPAPAVVTLSLPPGAVAHRAATRRPELLSSPVSSIIFLEKRQKYYVVFILPHCRGFALGLAAGCFVLAERRPPRLDRFDPSPCFRPLFACRALSFLAALSPRLGGSSRRAMSQPRPSARVSGCRLPRAFVHSRAVHTSGVPWASFLFSSVLRMWEFFIHSSTVI